MNETSLVQHSSQLNFNPVSISVKFNHNSDLTLFHLKVSDTGDRIEGRMMNRVPL